MKQWLVSKHTSPNEPQKENMPKVSPKDIRQQVLKDRGLTSFKPSKGQRRLLAVPAYQRCVEREKPKTPLMRYFELVKGQPIEEILVMGSLSYVARYLNNEVDTSTLSKWIKRLRLRYGRDNLPQCEGCGRRGSACQSGICYILLDLDRYDLLILKRKEMFDGEVRFG